MARASIDLADVLAPRIAALRIALRDALGTTTDPLGDDQRTSLPFVDLAIALEALDALVRARASHPALEGAARLHAERVFARASALALAAPFVLDAGERDAWRATVHHAQVGA